MILKKLIIDDNNMILMSSFLSNIAACSVTQGIHKLKRTLFGNLPPTAVTALLSGFHLAGLSVYLHWSETLENRTAWCSRCREPFPQETTHLYTHALLFHQ